MEKRGSIRECDNRVREEGEEGGAACQRVEQEEKTAKVSVCKPERGRGCRLNYDFCSRVSPDY